MDITFLFTLISFLFGMGSQYGLSSLFSRPDNKDTDSDDDDEKQAAVPSDPVPMRRYEIIATEVYTPEYSGGGIDIYKHRTYIKTYDPLGTRYTVDDLAGTLRVWKQEQYKYINWGNYGAEFFSTLTFAEAEQYGIVAQVPSAPEEPGVTPPAPGTMGQNFDDIEGECAVTELPTAVVRYLEERGADVERWRLGSLEYYKLDIKIKDDKLDLIITRMSRMRSRGAETLWTESNYALDSDLYVALANLIEPR